MGMINKILAGTGLLIFVYLVVKNSKAVTSVISQLSSSYNSGVKVLQGR